MSPKPIEITDEIKGLKACMNDLIGILALPSIWSGREQEHVLSTLLDAVGRVLKLDFVYAHLKNLDGKRFEMIRIADTENANINSDRLRQALKKWLRNNPEMRPSVLDGQKENSEFWLAALGLGVDERVGVFVAGSARPGFPNKSERLLLNVAANEAAIGLREAHLLSEQRRTEEASGPEMAELRMKYARLTPREREVLPFVVAGRLSKQTAAELGTSEITIRVHRGQIMRKMQAHSLAELIRMADALGIRELSGSVNLA
jgi:DNA-binding CsgD family transcriptional regulator